MLTRHAVTLYEGYQPTQLTCDTASKRPRCPQVEELIHFALSSSCLHRRRIQTCLDKPRMSCLGANMWNFSNCGAAKAKDQKSVKTQVRIGMSKGNVLVAENNKHQQTKANTCDQHNPLVLDGSLHDSLSSSQGHALFCMSILTLLKRDPTRFAAEGPARRRP